MKIDHVSSTDIVELKNLARNSILQSVEATIDTKKEIISNTYHHIDKCKDSLNCVFLKCSESTIVGYILVQNHWNLSDLYVKQSEQGRGVGALLLAQAKLACKKHGSLYVRVNSSVNAEGFYLKQGFVSYDHDENTPDFVVPLIYNF